MITIHSFCQLIPLLKQMPLPQYITIIQRSQTRNYLYCFLSFKIYFIEVWGFPCVTSGKELACQCRRHKRYRFYPWVQKIPWRRAWQPTPVFLPGESHRQRSLAGYRLQGCKESDTIEVTQYARTHGLGAGDKEMTTFKELKMQQENNTNICVYQALTVWQKQPQVLSMY